MEAAQWDPSQQKVVVNELPKPTPSDGQFLIKLASASLCHSDLMSMAMPHTEPVTIGHEGAGYIAEIHPSAESRGFKVGDAVGFTYIVNYCDECEGFAEYATVDASSCILLPKELPAETSAPMFCGGITGAYSPSSRKHDFGPQLTVLCI
jgi:D-arabinose 1-dehydrogenase-like Zn-dependent alcohol dehydrogenase